MAQLTNIDAQVQSFFKIQSLGKFLISLFQFALILGALATFLYLIWGSLEYVISGGNQDRTKSAKNKITEALTGFILLAVTWIIWRMVIYFLGISPNVTGGVEFKFLTP